MFLTVKFQVNNNTTRLLDFWHQWLDYGNKHKCCLITGLQLGAYKSPLHNHPTGLQSQLNCCRVC